MNLESSGIIWGQVETRPMRWSAIEDKSILSPGNFRFPFQLEQRHLNVLARAMKGPNWERKLIRLRRYWRRQYRIECRDIAHKRRLFKRDPIAFVRRFFPGARLLPYQEEMMRHLLNPSAELRIWPRSSGKNYVHKLVERIRKELELFE